MKSHESPGAEHLIERQMLLSRVRSVASSPGFTKQNPSAYRFVTITRDVGSLGDDVASAIANRLKWHVYDREIVDFVARDSHVRQDLVRELDERAQSLIYDTVQRLLRSAEGISFGNQEYHESLLKTLAILAAHGSAVIVGRGSVYALQEEPGVHIRIYASPETRIQRLARRWTTTSEVARHRMEKIDAERRSFRQHHFRRSVEELRFFNVVFNTDYLSVEQIVSAVAAFIEAGEAHRPKTPDPIHWKPKVVTPEPESIVK